MDEVEVSKPVVVPPGFRFDVFAAEIMSTLAGLIKHKGLPARVNMNGMPTKDSADRTRKALLSFIETIEEKWNKRRRLRFSVVVVRGKTEAKGYDVSVTVEAVSAVIVATVTPPTPAD